MPSFLLFVLLVAAAHAKSCLLTGVNQAGADFGDNVPGVLNKDYTYPTASADYFVNKGVNIFRLPFKWERVIQPNKASNWSTADINALIGSVNYMTGKGRYVILDPHDYARAWGGIIGQSSTTIEDFANFWAKLADLFKSNPKILYGLINEPNGVNITIWRNACQAAITAIRATGATQTILVPGNGYTGASSWLALNAEVLWDIYDPLNNYAYEVHSYLDVDSSGQHAPCVSATIGSSRLAQVTEWARNYNKMLFLGEFGGSDQPVCVAAIDDILTYMDNNNDVWLGWTYWAGGPWWGDDMLTVQPNSTGADRQQWAPIQKHLASSVPASVVVGHTTAPGPVYIGIYKDNGLMNYFGDFSWNTRDYGNTEKTHSGTSAVKFTVSNGDAMFFHCYDCINTATYDSIQFWINIGTGSSDGITFSLANYDSSPSAVHPVRTISSWINDTVAQNTWVKVTVPLSAYPAGTYDGIMIRGTSGSQTPSAWLDDAFMVKIAYPGQISTTTKSGSSATAASATTKSGSSTSGAATASGSTQTAASASGTTKSSAASSSAASSSAASSGAAASSSGSLTSTTGVKIPEPISFDLNGLIIISGNLTTYNLSALRHTIAAFLNVSDASVNIKAASINATTFSVVFGVTFSAINGSQIADTLFTQFTTGRQLDQSTGGAGNTVSSASYTVGPTDSDATTDDLSKINDGNKIASGMLVLLLSIALVVVM